MTAALPRAAGLLLLALVLAVPAAAAEDEPVGLPILESGSAAVDLGTRRLTVRYSTTIAGPLVEVEPLIRTLGGELEIGPLGDSHELTLNDRTFYFGPGSDALTYDKEIVDLSQAAIAGETGAQVPLDLLDHIYGHQLGYEFTWNPAARLLLVRHQPARELGLQFNLVHVQGVTTVVFQFSTRPRYRLRKTARSVTVELIGDRLAGNAPRSIPPDDLVRNVRVASGSVRLELADDAAVEDYLLDDPFRLVFDVFRRHGQREDIALAPPVGPRRRERPGISTIVLDPGHGGADTGAISSGGLEEKRLTLQLALLIKRLLEERLPVRVVLTRDADLEVPLESRAALANQNKGDLFVSLHLNSAVGSSAHGAETYFLSLNASGGATAVHGTQEGEAGVGPAAGDPLFDLQLLLWDLAQSRHLARSQTLAKLIQDELNQALELHNRGVKQAPLRVLTGVAMPAVLVEFGFLSNPEEEARLQDPLYRYRLADALVKAISRYRAGLQGVPEEPDGAVR